MNRLTAIFKGFLSKFFPLYPTGAVFLLTNQCNAHCKMCNVWKNKNRNLDIGLFTKLLKSPVFNKVENVVLSGGELTLRDDLNPFLETLLTACGNLQSITVSSNGFLPEKLLTIVTGLNDLRTTQKREFNIFVQLSLDGPGDIHNEIRGVADGFEKVMESVSILDQYISDMPWIKTHFVCVLQPENLNSIDTVRDFFDECSLPVTYTVVSNSSYLDFHQEKPLENHQNYRQILQRFFSDLLINSKIDPGKRFLYQDTLYWLKHGIRRYPCDLLNRTIVINHQARLIPCLNADSLSFPGYTDNWALETLWKSKVRKQTINHISKTRCPGCRLACGVNDFDVFKSYFFSAVHYTRNALF